MRNRDLMAAAMAAIFFVAVTPAAAATAPVKLLKSTADHSKFNRPAMVELAGLSCLDRLFTDAAPPQPFPALLVDAGVRCDVAA